MNTKDRTEHNTGSPSQSHPLARTNRGLKNPFSSSSSSSSPLGVQADVMDRISPISKRQPASFEQDHRVRASYARCGFAPTENGTRDRCSRRTHQILAATFPTRLFSMELIHPAVNVGRERERERGRGREKGKGKEKLQTIEFTPLLTLFFLPNFLLYPTLPKEQKKKKENSLRSRPSVHPSVHPPIKNTKPQSQVD